MGKFDKLDESGELGKLDELGELDELDELGELDDRVDQADMLARGLYWLKFETITH